MKTLFSKFVTPYLVNFKTSFAGVGMIATGVAILAGVGVKASDGDLDTSTAMEGWGLIVGGIGLIAGRDANKSSQDSGVRN